MFFYRTYNGAFHLQERYLSFPSAAKDAALTLFSRSLEAALLAFLQSFPLL